GLTPDGQRLLERIGPHLDAIGKALQPFAARHADRLAISATPSMASAWLVPPLGSFLAAHPQVEISLQSAEAVVAFARESQGVAAGGMAAAGRSGRPVGPLVRHLRRAAAGTLQRGVRRLRIAPPGRAGRRRRRPGPPHPRAPAARLRTAAAADPAAPEDPLRPL